MSDSRKKAQTEGVSTPLSQGSHTGGAHQVRKHIRYSPDPLDAAYINFDGLKGKDWKPDQIGLIEDESSMGGCGLVLHRYKFTEKLTKGSEVTIKLGRLDPLKAVCVYVVEVNELLLKAGFKFLE